MSKPRPCSECGATFEARAHNSKYCSKRCGAAAFNRARRERYAEDPEFRQSLIDKVTAFEAAKYRSDPEFRARKLAANTERSSERWHADAGYREQKRKASAERYATNPEHRNRKLASSRRFGRRKYAANRDDPEFMDMVRAKSRKRRALRLAVGSEPFTRQDVIDRDGTDCKLCGQVVDLELRWPDTLSPSIDHVIPLTLGGPDTLDNAQLAHLGCNMSKGNRFVGAMPADEDSRRRDAPRSTARPERDSA